MVLHSNEQILDIHISHILSLTQLIWLDNLITLDTSYRPFMKKKPWDFLDYAIFNIKNDWNDFSAWKTVNGSCAINGSRDIANLTSFTVFHQGRVLNRAHYSLVHFPNRPPNPKQIVTSEPTWVGYSRKNRIEKYNGKSLIYRITSIKHPGRLSFFFTFRGERLLNFVKNHK